MKHLSHYLLIGILASLPACGSSGSSSSSDSGGSGDGTSQVTVSSLTDIPSLTDIVASSSSQSSSARIHSAVSGTPPILQDIDATSADTYFWNGLVATINTAGSVASDEQAGEFWDGEGSCRMAQNVGYSFQNIQQAGTSLCYMKNAPEASSGTSITSGSITDPSELFTPTADSRIVKVAVSGDEEVGEQNIFIRVYGTGTTEGAAGFAADLWFCNTESTATGYEQLRINSSTGVMTQTSVSTDFGNFTSLFNGQLTADLNGNPIFDSAVAQTVEYTFASEEFGTNKGYVSVLDGEMTTKNWNSNGDGSSGKNYIISSYTGDDITELQFNSAGFANQWSFDGTDTDTFYGASEFRDTTYVADDSIALFDDTNNFDFTTDSFWDGELEADSEALAATADYDCTATPDSVVAMDMSDAAFQAEVVSACENNFEDMNFCDSESISQARSAVFQFYSEQQ